MVLDRKGHCHIESRTFQDMLDHKRRIPDRSRTGPLEVIAKQVTIAFTESLKLRSVRRSISSHVFKTEAMS